MNTSSISRRALALTCLYFTASSLLADTSAAISEQLERAVFLQEAKADYEGAISLYRNIVSQAEASRAEAAEAHYRLAVCLLESGAKSEAVQAFETLMETYPNQTKWVEAALQHLPEPFAYQGTLWKDGEALRYRWTLSDGRLIGYHFMRAEKKEQSGKPVWEFIDRRILGGKHVLNTVTYEAGTLRPLSSQMQLPGLGLARAVYDQAQGKVTVAYDSQAEDRVFDISAKTFDNEQAFILMQQFPAEVGFKKSIEVFAPVSGVRIPVSVEVVALENVTVGDRSTECLRLDLGVMGTTQSFWYTNDDARYLAKMELEDVTVQLEGHRVIDEDEWSRDQIQEFGFSIEHPALWMPCPLPSNDGEKQGNTHFLEPSNQFAFSIYSNLIENLSGPEPFGLGAWSVRVKSQLAKSDSFQKFRQPSFEVSIPHAESAMLQIYEKRGDELQIVTKVLVVGKERTALITAATPSENAFKWEGTFRRVIESLEIE